MKNTDDLLNEFAGLDSYISNNPQEIYNDGYRDGYNACIREFFGVDLETEYTYEDMDVSDFYFPNK